MAIGLGIHGRSLVLKAKVDVPTADELAEMLVN